MTAAMQTSILRSNEWLPKSFAEPTQVRSALSVNNSMSILVSLSLDQNVSFCQQPLGYAMYNRPITTKYMTMDANLMQHVGKRPPTCCCAGTAEQEAKPSSQQGAIAIVASSSSAVSPYSSHSNDLSLPAMTTWRSVKHRLRKDSKLSVLTYTCLLRLFLM